MKRLALLATLAFLLPFAGGCLEFAALLTNPAGEVEDDNNSPPSRPDNNDDDDDEGDVDTTGVPALPEGATLTTSDSGLRFYDYSIGEGEQPGATDSVRVNYTGYLEDGTIFDDGEGVVFGLTGVIRGFSEGIQGMREGGRRRLVIPPDLGYGPNGNPGAGIGGDDTIIFDVELLEIVQ
jgi:hypothetical protein